MMRHPHGLQSAMATTDQGALFSGGWRTVNSLKKLCIVVQRVVVRCRGPMSLCPLTFSTVCSKTELEMSIPLVYVLIIGGEYFLIWTETRQGPLMSNL